MLAIGRTMRDEARRVENWIGVECRFYLLAWPSFIYGLIWSLVMSKQFDVLRVANALGGLLTCRVWVQKSGKCANVFVWKHLQILIASHGSTGFAVGKSNSPNTSFVTGVLDAFYIKNIIKNANRRRAKEVNLGLLRFNELGLGWRHLLHSITPKKENNIVQKILFDLFFRFLLCRLCWLWTVCRLLYGRLALLWSGRSRQTSSLHKDQTVKFGNNFGIFCYIEPDYKLHAKEDDYSKNSWMCAWNGNNTFRG